MQTTNDFLDMLKASRGLASDYAIAKFLGCGQSRITNYRKKRSTLGDEEAILMAELLEIDPAYVLANIHAERAKGEVEKQVWKDLVKRLSGTAAALLLAFVALDESPFYADGVKIDREYVYYVKSRFFYPAGLILFFYTLFPVFPRYQRISLTRIINGRLR